MILADKPRAQGVYFVFSVLCLSVSFTQQNLLRWDLLGCIGSGSELQTPIGDFLSSNLPGRRT